MRGFCILLVQVYRCMQVGRVSSTDKDCIETATHHPFRPPNQFLLRGASAFYTNLYVGFQAAVLFYKGHLQGFVLLINLLTCLKLKISIQTFDGFSIRYSFPSFEHSVMGLMRVRNLNIEFSNYGLLTLIKKFSTIHQLRHSRRCFIASAHFSEYQYISKYSFFMNYFAV